ncbi:hypothetical protein BJV82DRAFT_611638 [Fennellomyces sp. T-0311]|nr:hypothetical protein BJV82DRAFT_611638 [Fennellomyces sp. T-0311]
MGKNVTLKLTSTSMATEIDDMIQRKISRTIMAGDTHFPLPAGRICLGLSRSYALGTGPCRRRWSLSIASVASMAAGINDMIQRKISRTIMVGDTHFPLPAGRICLGLSRSYALGTGSCRVGWSSRIASVLIENWRHLAADRNPKSAVPSCDFDDHSNPTSKATSELIFVSAEPRTSQSEQASA